MSEMPFYQSVARGIDGPGESLIITDPKSELYESMSYIWRRKAILSNASTWSTRKTPTVELPDGDQWL